MVRRALVRVLDTLGLLVVALVALVAGALLHVGTRPGLALVRWAVPAATADMFRGALDVRHLGSVGPRGLRDVDLRVLAPNGDTLVWGEGVDVVLDVPAVIERALAGKGPLEVRVDAISARHLSLDLSAEKAADGTSSLALANAFAPKIPKPADPTSGPSPTIELADIRVHHAWIYGTPAEGVRLDADLA